MGAPTGTWFNGELEVFAVGTDYQGYVQKWNGATGWTGWMLLGGGRSALTAPSEEITTARRSNGSIDVFIRGSDYSGWHAVTDQHGTLTNGWESLGGRLLGDPDATWSGSSLFVFAVGSDHGLFRNTYAGGWSGWAAIGGTSATRTTEHVTVALRANGAMDLFVLGTDTAIWHATTDASGVPVSWESIGGRLLGPAWASWGSSALDVVAVGTDSRPYGDEFTSVWSGWSLLAGNGVSG